MKIKGRDASFYDFLPDGVMIVDAEGQILYANPAMAKILKKPLSEIMGRRCCELVHGTTERPPFCVQARMNLKGETAWEEFYEPNLKAWIWAYAAPLRDESGKIIACFHLIRDITQEKKNLVGKHLFEKIVETIPAFFYLSDKDYRILFANQKFKEWIGTEPVGKKCYEVIYGRNKPCEWCRQKEIFEEGKTLSWETEYPKDHRWYM
ncbi:MAG TPA: PAS domain-containing protein, partial [Thermodesulfobacteriaceae bacterium]|nr:PAS domain-containing protein [Thermodesulfobacteriaceae bacterium]